jgi:hypothetical protein
MGSIYKYSVVLPVADKLPHVRPCMPLATTPSSASIAKNNYLTPSSHPSSFLSGSEPPKKGLRPRENMTIICLPFPPQTNNRLLLTRWRNVSCLYTIYPLGQLASMLGLAGLDGSHQHQILFPGETSLEKTGIHTVCWGWQD